MAKFNIGSGLLERAKSTFQARKPAGGSAAPADTPLRKARASGAGGLRSKIRAKAVAKSASAGSGKSAIGRAAAKARSGGNGFKNKAGGKV